MTPANTVERFGVIQTGPDQLRGGDGEERACGSPAERGSEAIEQHQMQDVFSFRP